MVEKKNFMNKNFTEEIIFSKFGQKRHGWTKICQIVTYSSFLQTMTFFFFTVGICKVFELPIKLPITIHYW